jgi:hypothetical protein
MQKDHFVGSQRKAGPRPALRGRHSHGGCFGARVSNRLCVNDESSGTIFTGRERKASRFSPREKTFRLRAIQFILPL